MTDSRSISGKVHVVGESAAKIAYDMASSLWWEEHQTHPKMSNTEFFDLVQNCARSLSANYNFHTL